MQHVISLYLHQRRAHRGIKRGSRHRIVAAEGLWIIQYGWRIPGGISYHLTSPLCAATTRSYKSMATLPPKDSRQRYGSTQIYSFQCIMTRVNINHRVDHRGYPPTRPLPRWQNIKPFSWVANSTFPRWRSVNIFFWWIAAAFIKQVSPNDRPPRIGALLYPGSHPA
jgi:hypothetical protein